MSPFGRNKKTTLLEVERKRKGKKRKPTPKSTYALIPSWDRRSTEILVWVKRVLTLKNPTGGEKREGKREFGGKKGLGMLEYLKLSAILSLPLS